ncbi:Type 1 glutamine amidotransferase-like domain-containing protein [Actinomycetes bacterium KLBMP 9759]
MRLYLSSYRLGNRPEELLRLLPAGRRTALILNAYDDFGDEQRASSLARELSELNDAGLVPEELDLRLFFGRTEELRAALDGFDLVYVRGGNVFVLQRAFRHSGADAVFTDLLARDLVAYAGYSAGACVLGSTLRGIEGEVDDPYAVPAGYPTAAPSWEGVGVVPFAIAPHFRSDHPESGEIERTVRYFIDNHIPFIALRDGEAIVVDGDHVVVVG